MKRSAKLLALAGALAVLVGAWLLVESMSGKLAEAEAEETDQTESIDLSAGPAEDITALSWTYNGETVSLSRNAQSGQWENDNDALCPLDETAVDALVQAAASVSATMKVTDVTDFAQYGLDEPALTVSAASADAETTYEVGGTSLTGEYYIRVNGETTVYTETGVLVPAFEIGIDDLLALESTPDDIVTVIGMTVETPVESYELSWLDDASAVSYSDTSSWFRIEDDTWTPLDTAQVTALYETVTNISFVACETWNAENPADYGLETPQGTVTVTYLDEAGAEKTFSLEFGDYASGYIYVRPVGSSMVYLASGTVLDGLMYPDWAAMTPLEVCPLDWDTVTGALVEMGGQTFEIQKYSEPAEETREEESAGEDDTAGSEESAESEQTMVNYYTANGWTLDADAMEAWLSELSALTGESLADTQEGRDQVLRVTFYRDAEFSPEVTLEFQSYDSARYLCIVNGEKTLLVARDGVEALITAAESLFIVE